MDEQIIGALHDESLEQLALIRAYRTYQGTNAEYRNKGKDGAWRHRQLRAAAGHDGERAQQRADRV